MESVVQKKKQCLICKTTKDLHEHHVFYGTGNRKVSERLGMKVYLCKYHHNGSDAGVHFDRELDLRIKRACQYIYERDIGTREEFIKDFGRSYL